MKHYVHILLLVLSGIFGLQALTPVASYTFTGNAKDGSSFQNHGSVNGANLAADRFGSPNSAFSFDGKQSAVTVPNGGQLQSGSTSISFWVNVRSLPAQGEAYILSHGGWQQRWKISLPSHGKPVFTTHAATCCNDMDSGDGNELKVNEWRHVVMTHDGTTDRIYMNGVQVNEKAYAGALNQTSHPFGIGYDPIDKANYFDGLLDDVMIFDEALTASQINDLYIEQSTVLPVPATLVASYHFDEFGKDGSGFGNTATLRSANQTTDRFGYGKSAVLFDGTGSEVSASNAAHLNSATATVSMWVKVNSLPANGEAFLISNGGWQERLKISLPTHGKPVFTTNYSGGISDMDSGDGNELKPGQWTHLVFVHDGSKNKIFLDGVLKAEKNVSGDLNSTTRPLGIGYNAIDGGNWFDGVIDDVEIYNYALTDEAILELHNTQSEFSGEDNNLVASYSLNGSGHDGSQFNNHAALEESAFAVSNRHGWANNALHGAAVADNSIALQTDFTTISFWVNPTRLPASGEVYLLSNGGWQERWKISLPSHGKPVFTTHATSCCSDLDSGDGNDLKEGQWTHVAMVHDGTSDIIYVNGVLANQKSSAGALNKTKFPLGIGFDPIDNGNYFDGSIDDVMIFDEALSAAQIAALYDLQNEEPVVSSELVADYSFAGNLYDATEYNNHANGNAKSTKDRFGKVNKARVFDGTSSYLEAANSPQLASDYTSISFWAKVNSLPASGEVYILSHGGWQERWKISLPSHGKPVFTTHATSCCNDMDSGDGNALEVNEWTHVVMTHDGTVDRIFMNGVKVNEKAYSGPLNKTTHPFGIGFDPIDRGNYFDGSLDEVQIYNRALTEEEVLGLYILQSIPPVEDDTESPCAPLDLSATVSFTNVELFWALATDNVGVAGYNVYQDGELIASVEDLSLYISNLNPLTEFVFGVSAFDAAGNESLVTTLSVTTDQEETPDTTPPTKPGNLRGSAGSNSVLLAWDPSVDDRKLQGYVVLVDGFFFDSLSDLAVSVLVGGLDTETAYTFEVYAFDLSGNESEIAEVTIATTKPLDTGEAGLVAHYPFDGNANDATPYNNHGVIGGNPVFEPSTHPLGAGGQNIKFDGDRDSVLVANAVHLISDYTTVSFWIRVDGQNASVAESYVIDFGHWDERWKISLPQHLKIVWTTNGNNTQFPTFISDMDSGDGNEMVKGFWWHVTMVHDGARNIVYVNGEEVNSKPVPTKLNSTSRPLCFGSNPIEGGQYFQGALDNVKIYNKALTATEIAKLYSSGTTGIKDFAQVAYGNVSVTPNPVSDFLMINHSFDVKNNIKIRVLDQMGRQLDGFVPSAGDIQSGRIAMNTFGLAQGMYFVNFIVDGVNIGSVRFNKI
ncbi:MAG: hypothetical protein IPM42_14995 [Saprospiraceae bacterium]|nr:hypothetical protein [Saprospiraceae bacterium]